MLDDLVWTTLSVNYFIM